MSANGGAIPPKKRRSVANDESIQNKRSKAADTRNEFENVIAKIKVEDKDVALKSAKKLKAMLPNETKIGSFVSHKKNLEDLVSVFSRETSLLGTSMLVISRKP